ncbi:MAG TPA: putative baseplate assembly protein [Pyrinomonadaceae bacterium]|nr:putative baseplate assembly protein [Pyrinomonadaceae bacterium]
MALVLPNLDDKPFEQIVEEARLLIPSNAPEWTDHNVHDPGITFTELFAWLAEISHYRLNRTSAASYERFFSLMGVTPESARAAEVTVAFEFDPLSQGLLIPANTKMSAIGIDDAPFQTVADQYLTKAKVKRVVTEAGGRQIVQTTAEKNEAGHYEAFGPSPTAGDFLRLEFENWFDEPRGQFHVTLFEDDLPARKPFSEKSDAFEPSAKIRWEYRSDAPGVSAEQWNELKVIDDGTLSFSRSGDVVFESPTEPAASQHKELRAVVLEGRFEIPPRVVAIRTNTVRARQVETIVNEDLGPGLGTADQLVGLKKFPLLINNEVDDGPFQVGEVLDWEALTARLRDAENLYKSPLKETVIYLREKLQALAGDDISATPSDFRNRQYRLAQAVDRLITDPDLYQREKFKDLNIPEELVESRRCRNQSTSRRFNRLILQLVFPDLVVSDRCEIQVGVRAADVEDEFKTWRTWRRVEDFLESGPDDYHYVLDPETGTVLFGNGLNGRVPQATELIRARFYRHSQYENGNIKAGHQWVLDLVPTSTRIVNRVNTTAASGGRSKESVDDTKIRTRAVFHKERAVLTQTDYETLALNTPGLRVARAKLVANFNPKFRSLKLPGEVTLIVEAQPPPRAAFPNATPATPSKGFLATIKNYIESRRVVTTNVNVIGPEYVNVNVSGNVFLKKRVSESETRESINRALAEFFDPVFGGPVAGQGWPFGRAIFPSEISQQLVKVDGVDYVTKIAINGLEPGTPLRMPYNGLPAPGKHSITTVTFEARRQNADSAQPRKNCG